MTSEPLEERYSELAELAGGFIHDIKNHLGTLVLNLQLLAEDFQNPQTPRERRALTRVERLQNECQRLVNLSNEFLRFAHVQQLHRESARLDQIVGEMVDFYTPLAQQANVTIHSFVPADLPLIQVDRELFKQVLLNLLLNAEQAMPDGGEIIFQAQRDHDFIVLDVIDTGTGMPPEVLAKVFKPFHTTKPGGTGLGLATARRVIEAHGGTIHVASEVNRGTKFSIRLPVA